jgi:hypothetical protein
LGGEHILGTQVVADPTGAAALLIYLNPHVKAVRAHRVTSTEYEESRFESIARQPGVSAVVMPLTGNP